MTTEALRRALARRKFCECEDSSTARFSSVGIMNMYGSPIGKPVCIRSLRRAQRQWLVLWAGHDGSDTPATTYRKNSSKRIAQSVRQINKAINRRRK